MLALLVVVATQTAAPSTSPTCSRPAVGTGACTAHPVCASTNEQNLGAFYASCNSPLNGWCMEYGAGYNASNTSTQQSDCSSMGTWSTTARCPTANRLATGVATNAGQTGAFSAYRPTYASTAAAGVAIDSAFASMTTCTYSEP